VRRGSESGEPITIGKVWLARGTQNNREPARQKERNEKEETKRRGEGSSARPKKARGKKNKGERKEDTVRKRQGGTGVLVQAFN
jgi:hypothetical protein